jgi:hypothetical protein
LAPRLRSTPDSSQPAALADLSRELPDDFLLHSMTGHSEAHQGLREQLIEHSPRGCAERHFGNPWQ